MSVTISGSGQIITQVVQTVKTDTYSVNTGGNTSWSDVTGLSVSITPTNASNKIRISYTLQTSQSGSSNYAMMTRLVRNSTVIAVGNARGSATSCTADSQLQYPSGCTTHAFEFLDSPATTSAVTYKIQCSNEAGVTMIVGGSYNSAATSNSSQPSSITAMEVAYA